VECAQIQFLVSAQSSFDCPLSFGECRRIKNDGIESLFGIRPVAKYLKGVALDPVNRCGESAPIGFNVSLRHFERAVRCVNPCDVITHLSQMVSEATLVAANIQC